MATDQRTSTRQPLRPCQECNHKTCQRQRNLHRAHDSDYTYSDSVRELGRLNETQVTRLLADHSVSFIEFDADIEYDHDSQTWSADDVLEWLGY